MTHRNTVRLRRKLGLVPWTRDDSRVLVVPAETRLSPRFRSRCESSRAAKILVFSSTDFSLFRLRSSPNSQVLP
jgi:hypothetical protein